MPAAATHDRIALYTAGALIVPGYLALRYGFDDAPEAAYTGTLLIVGAHLFGSWMLSPDLDLDGRIDDRWGPFRPIWVPYMRLVPHRHFLSHSGFSGVLRLGYLYLVITGILAGLSFVAYLLHIDVAYHRDFSEWLWDTMRNGSRPALLLIVGVVMSDLMHVIADYIHTRRKRLFGAKRRR